MVERPSHRHGQPWTPGERAAYYRDFISSHRAAANAVRPSDRAYAAELDGMADDRQGSLDALMAEHGDALDGVWMDAGRFAYAEGYSDELGRGWS
jgi:hypothetical protein